MEAGVASRQTPLLVFTLRGLDGRWVGGIKGWEGQLARINILQNFKLSGPWPLSFIISENSTSFANISRSCTFVSLFLRMT